MLYAIGLIVCIIIAIRAAKKGDCVEYHPWWD